MTHNNQNSNWGHFCCQFSTKSKWSPQNTTWAQEKNKQMIHLNKASTRSCNGYRGNGVWLRKLLENLGRNGIKDHVWKIIKINSPAHSPRRWRRWCQPPPRGGTSCPGTIRPPPLSWEPTAEKIHAWPDFPTSRSRTSSQRFPCRFQLARSGSEPSLCPKDSQPTLQLLLRQK